MDLHQLILEAQRASGKSWLQISRETGIDPGSLWRWRNGKQRLREDRLERLMRAVGVRLEPRD